MAVEIIAKAVLWCIHNNKSIFDAYNVITLKYLYTKTINNHFWYNTLLTTYTNGKIITSNRTTALISTKKKYHMSGFSPNIYGKRYTTSKYSVLDGVTSLPRRTARPCLTQRKLFSGQLVFGSSKTSIKLSFVLNPLSGCWCGLKQSNCNYKRGVGNWGFQCTMNATPQCRKLWIRFRFNWKLAELRAA